jgi:HEAT repeat protein
VVSAQAIRPFFNVQHRDHFLFIPGANRLTKRNWIRMAAIVVILSISGCTNDERGPILAGGREVKSWLTDLQDPQPQVRRQAVLKLGNVGEADPSVVEGLAGALRDKDVVVRREAVRAVVKLTKATDTITAELKAIAASDCDSLARDYAQRAIAHFDKRE